MLRKCVEKLPSVTVLTITFEWLRIFGHGLNILESKHSKLEFEHKFCIFSKEIKRVIVVSICPSEFSKIWNPIMCRWRGVKMEVKQFAHKFGLEIFFLYCKINNLKIKFFVKKT